MLLFGHFDPAALVAIGIVLFFGMGIHEYAHALVADWWGDPTPRQMGRLTPNPIVHINWIGWLMFLIVGFGILGSVPINPRQMRDPRWGSFWTSFAGPLSNLAQAILYGILLFAFSIFLPVSAINGLSIWWSDANIGTFANAGYDFISLFLVVGIFYNVLLFVFNLLPLYPIDGWRMLLAVLPGEGLAWTDIPAFIRQSLTPLAAFLNRPAYKWSEWAQVSQYVFFGLILISFAVPQFDILSLLISRPTQQISFLLMGFGF